MRGRVRQLFKIKCPAPPHDLLKLIYWPEHGDPRRAERYLPQEIMEKCPELWRWIRYHGKSDKKSYHIPDILSATIARPHMRYNYWDVSPSGWGSKDLLLIRLYMNQSFGPLILRLGGDDLCE